MNLLRFSILAAIFTSVASIMLFAVGQYFPATILCLVLSYLIPVAFQKNKQIDKTLSIKIDSKFLVYADIIWATFFLAGGGTIVDIQLKQGFAWLIYPIMLASYAIFQMLVVFTARCIEDWFRQNKNNTSIKISFISLMIVMIPIQGAAVFGAACSLKYWLPHVSQLWVGTIMYIYQFYIFFMLGVLTIYLYTTKKFYHRWIKIICIVGSSFGWLVMKSIIASYEPALFFINLQRTTRFGVEVGIKVRAFLLAVQYIIDDIIALIIVLIICKVSEVIDCKLHKHKINKIEQ